MATNRTVTTNQLKPNTEVLVRGKLEYSRLDRQISGEKLIEDQKSRKMRGIPIINRPYTIATISDPQVLPKSQGVQKSLEEIYMTESIYTQKASGKYMFQGINKGNRLPNVYELDPTTGKYNQKVLKHNLANGLDVTLVLRVFEAQPNNGVTLASVLINEPLRYYQAYDATVELSKYGFEFGTILDPDEVEKQQQEVKLQNDEDLNNATMTNDSPFGQEVPPANQPSFPQSQSNFPMPENPYNGQNVQNNGIRYTPQERNY